MVARGQLGGPRLGFNWDGGAPEKLTIGATGGERLEFELRGVAAHAGGAPERGASAIAAAALAIGQLHREGWHGLIRKGGRTGTSNVGTIHGGAATNVVADHVSVRAEARSHDPEFRRRIAREVEEAFTVASAQVANQDGTAVQVTCRHRVDYEAFCLDIGEPCVTMAQAAVRAIGREPVPAVANGGIDANWTVRHGIPTVSLGCGQRHQHTVQESLNLVEFHDACRIARHLALDGA